MKVKNKHGRKGVKRPLAGDQRRRAFLEGFRRGAAERERMLVNQILRAKSLRELKKELGL